MCIRKLSFRLGLALVAIVAGLSRAGAAPKEKTLSTLLQPVCSQAGSRTVRVMMGGTSIASFGYSNNQLFVSQLKAIYGDARADVRRMGVINGSWDLPAMGWNKQPYSGPSFVRLRGDASSQPLELTGYGSRIVVEYSKEANGGVCGLLLGGAPSGTIDCGGPQTLSVRSILQVPAGLHRLGIQPPAGGYAYLERVIFEQDRPGIEVIDGTLGGSGLRDVFEVRSRGGASVGGVPTEPGAGVRAYFGRPDVDLAIWSGPVNDSGGSNPDFATWAARMNEVVDATRTKKVQIATNTVGSVSLVTTKTPHGLRTGDEVKISVVSYSRPAINGTHLVTVLSPTTFTVPVAVKTAGRGGTMTKSGCPLLLIAEMGGHFSMPADPDYAAFQQKHDYLVQLARENDHVFTLDWHSTTLEGDFVQYAGDFYDTGAPVEVDPESGAFTGDFIHPNPSAHQIALELLCQSMDIPTPPEASAADLENRIRKTSPVKVGSRVRFMDGTVRRNGITVGVGAAVFGAETYVGTLPLVFSEETANLTDWNQKIAGSGSSDRFGKFTSCGQDVGVPILERVNVGERVTVTVLMKPVVPGLPMRVRSPANGAGVMYYKDTVLPQCSTVLFDPEEMPMWVTFDYVRGAHSSLLFSGRLYSISVTRTNGQPVSTERREFNVSADLETLPATDIASVTATVNAAVRSGGQGTLSVCFDYGTTRYVVESANRNAIVIDDGALVGVEQTLTGLRPNTTYFYRARAMSPGNPISQVGEVLKFRTRAGP